MPIDDGILESLSAVLGCSSDYLTRNVAELVSTQPHLRAYADASKKTVDRAVADSVTAVEFARTLGLRTVRDVLPLYEGDLNDEDEIERFASEVRAIGGLDSAIAVGNSVRTAERLGCLVLPLDSELGRHLGLSMRVDGVPVIRISRSSEDPDLAVPGDRQRFTVAHELGHLVLHHSIAQPNSPVEAAKLERQAHRFASAFLAPGDAILEDLDALGGRVTLTTLSSLKAKWGFAIKAFVVRFQQLGVIDDDHARSLYKQISARRWNKSEPVSVGNESAVWFSKALEKRSFELSLPLASLTSRAGVDVAYLDRWTNWSPAARSNEGALVSLLPAPRNRQGRQQTVADRDVARLPFRPSL
jgi:Zn-dependent peptidase ImmA (M78 family)